MPISVLKLIRYILVYYFIKILYSSFKNNLLYKEYNIEITTNIILEIRNFLVKYYNNIFSSKPLEILLLLSLSLLVYFSLYVLML